MFLTYTRIEMCLRLELEGSWFVGLFDVRTECVGYFWAEYVHHGGACPRDDENLKPKRRNRGSKKTRVGVLNEDMPYRIPYYAAQCQ